MVGFDMDVLVIGCGLSGAVVARHLAEENRSLFSGECNIIGRNIYSLDEYDF